MAVSDVERGMGFGHISSADADERGSAPRCSTRTPDDCYTELGNQLWSAKIRLTSV
jgi:hypothetical protein